MAHLIPGVMCPENFDLSESKMIRKYNDSDTEAVLAIWLEASIKAHDFVEAEFWKSQLENMRKIYIPASDTYV